MAGLTACPEIMSKEEKKKEEFNAAAAGKYPEMALEDLLPTQITVGMLAMRHKAHHLHSLKNDPKKLKEYLDARPIEIVLGPGGKAYVIDHHHLALAMIHEGYKTAQVKIVTDFSNETSQDAFWKKMEEGDGKGKKYVHPYDENGKLRAISALPRRLKDLIDDPYRSLAGFVRDNGGFKKDFTPFAEFEWADHFRKLIPLKEVNDHFGKSLRLAMKLARLPEAAHLPGFLGPKKKPGPKAA